MEAYADALQGHAQPSIPPPVPTASDVLSKAAFLLVMRMRMVRPVGLHWSRGWMDTRWSLGVGTPDPSTVLQDRRLHPVEFQCSTTCSNVRSDVDVRQAAAHW
jgi:hypothetical protein